MSAAGRMMFVPGGVRVARIVAGSVEFDFKRFYEAFEDPRGKNLLGVEPLEFRMCP